MTRMQRLLSIAAASLAYLIITPAGARAGQVKFAAQHPVPKAVAAEDSFCYIDVPHVHIYEPDHAKVLYRQHEGAYHFVGDPAAFGYEGPKHGYYGHHPVEVDPAVYVDVDVEPVTEFCYLDGPHFHDDAPPAGVNFELKGGAYWYIGKYPKDYHKHKKHYTQINIIYKPIVYVRPVVVVEAPAGYLGPILDVHITVPTVEVGIGLPGVIIDHRHHHKHKHYKHKHYKHKKHKKWKH
jgi:hypothetical protein